MRRIIFIVGILICIFCKSTIAYSFSDVDIHGFISQGFLQSDKVNLFGIDTQNGTFQFNEMGLNFTKHAGDGLQIGMQVFARDLGSLGNDDIIVDWAYGDYFYRKWLGIRAGKLKVYHGLYNDTRDIDMLRVSIFLPQSAYLEMYRDVFVGAKGVGCYGELPGNISYRLISGVVDIKPDSAFISTFKYFLLTDFNDLDVTHYSNGSLIWEAPSKGLKIGSTLIHTTLEGEGGNIIEYPGGIPVQIPRIEDMSESDLIAYLNSVNTVDMEYNIYTISGEYILDNLFLYAEYSQFRLDYAVVSLNPLLLLPDTLKTGGYYLGAAYRFSDLFELGGYYSELYYDMDEKEDATRFAGTLGEYGFYKDSALSARFDMNDNWVFKLEIHSIRGTYLTSGGNVDSSETPGMGASTGPWWLYAVKTTFSF